MAAVAEAGGGSGATLYSMAVEFFGDMTKLKSDMRTVEREAVQSGDKVGSQFALGFNNPLLNAIGGVRQLVGGVQDSLGILSVTTGVQIAATYQRLQLGFQTLTGSASSAKAIMSDLAKMGSSTPFHTEDLTAYAQGLLALGVNANRVTGDLSALADVTAARGGSTGDLGELSNIVSGFRLRPRLDIREVSEIGRFMDLTKIVGAATGRTGLNELQAAGVLSNMRGDKAYETVISGAQKVYGGAAAGQGGNTVQGLTQNLQESISLAMKPTGDALLPVIGAVEKAAISAAGGLTQFNQATGGSAGLVFVMIAGVTIVRRFAGTAKNAWDVTTGLATAVSEYALAADQAAKATVRAGLADGEKAAVDSGAAAATGGAAAAEAETVAVAGGSMLTLGKLATLGAKASKILSGFVNLIPLGIDLAANYEGQQLLKSKDRSTRIGGGALTGFGTGVGIGGLVGGLIGSIVPGLGTGIGIAVGGTIGGLIGTSVGANKQANTEDAATKKNTDALNANTVAMNRMSIKVFGGGPRANGTASLLEAEYAFARGI